MSDNQEKTILISRFWGQKLTASHDLVALLTTDEFQPDSPVPFLTSEKDLRTFLGEHQVNAFLYLEKEKEFYQKLEDLVLQTGLPILCQTATGELLGQHELPVTRRPFGRLVKRLFDVLVAVLGLGLTAVVATVLYPFVQQQAPGPLLFKQERVGKQGKRFVMYKFRSMYVGADEQKAELLEQNDVQTEHMFKMDNDPRIFPLGQKIRDWSIDELPQFINVLKGDMSLIGTRPPTVDEVSRYELHHFKRLAMKPGITGRWQVSGRSNITDFEQVVALDVSYIDNWSIWLDIKIIFKTVAVVLKREGSK